jgi:hypothetical protein
LSGQFLTPYPYVAIFFAATATAVTQIGFLRGRAVEVVPSVNAAIILSPLILEGIIYRQLPSGSILAFVAVVVAGVLLLSTGAAARAEMARAEKGTG